MNILRVKPEYNDLRAYFYNAVNSSFGISDNISKYLLDTCFKNKTCISDCELASLSNAEVEQALEKHNLLPEYLYFIVDKDKNRLSRPFYFTRVMRLNLDEGLVVFEAYNLQIYYLLNSSGCELEGPCFDLDLGAGGLIQFRKSGGDPVFRLKKLRDNDFHEIGGISPFNDFPYINDVLNLNFKENLFYADSRIDDTTRNNRDYILEAVKHNGWSLKFASEDLKDDEEIVTIACAVDPASIRFASLRLKTDKELIFKLIIENKHRMDIYENLPVSMQNDDDIRRLADLLKGDFREFSVFSENNILHKYNRSLILMVLKTNPDVFKTLPQQYRDDNQIALTAIKGNIKNFGFCSERLKADVDILNTVRETTEQEKLLKDLPF